LKLNKIETAFENQNRKTELPFTQGQCLNLSYRTSKVTNVTAVFQIIA